MAYLHCHNCGWSQDDFWDWKIKWRELFHWKSRPFGYNPLSLILEDIAEYYNFRFIEMDIGWMKENKYKGNKIHSWKLLWKHGILIHLRRLFNQKWWTYKQFKKDSDKNIAKCPKCKSKSNFDID